MTHIEILSIKSGNAHKALEIADFLVKVKHPGIQRCQIQCPTCAPTYEISIPIESDLLILGLLFVASFACLQRISTILKDSRLRYVKRKNQNLVNFSHTNFKPSAGNLSINQAL